MAYGEAKVYFDGSHYIAIPHTESLTKKRKNPQPELVEVKENNLNHEGESTPSTMENVPSELE